MMPVAFPNWGERSWLHDKSLQYVFTLDLLYRAPVSPQAAVGSTTRLPLVAVPPQGKQLSTYRVIGPPLFRGTDNIEREVPEARVISGGDSLVLLEEGVSPLEGHLLLEVGTLDPLVISYSGVLDLAGGTAQMAAPLAPNIGPPGPPVSRPVSYDQSQNIGGRAFIATRQEVGIPRYRWLIYNQLVGVGRVQALVPTGSDPWLLQLSFDLYLGL